MLPKTFVRSAAAAGAALGVVLVLAPALATARVSKKVAFGGWIAERVRDGIVKRLDLTQWQQEELRTVFRGHYDTAFEEMVAVKAARQALLERIQRESMSEGEIRDAYEAVAAAELDLVLHASDLFIEVRSVLTPEQEAEADRIREEMMGLFDDWFEHLRDRFGESVI